MSRLLRRCVPVLVVLGMFPVMHVLGGNIQQQGTLTKFNSQGARDSLVFPRKFSG